MNMKDKAFLKEYFLKPLCYAAVIILSLFVLNKFTTFNLTLSSSSNTNTFEVVGTGKVTATPNIAETSFTIQEKGDTQDQAKSKANDKQNQAISELTKLGIKKADIKSDLSVTQNYEDSTPQPMGTMMYPIRRTVQNGYIATINTTVKANKVDLLNQAIDKLTPLGINVGGVNYTFADPETYKEQAVQKAVEDAKQKAEALAKTGGFHVGRLVTIRNVDDTGYVQPMMGTALKAAPSADSTTNLQPGSNDITARVAITYYIK